MTSLVGRRQATAGPPPSAIFGPTGSATGAVGFGVSALNMMALAPGKERSADEYKRLFERSCLRSILPDFDFKIFERNIEIYAKRIDQGTYP
ncbi:MAG: hypothetical protein WBE80_04705 [Methylocella sp.]